MKSFGHYIFSLLLSVVLVFVSLSAMLALVITVNVNADKMCSLSQEKQLPEKIIAELDKYYKEKYNTTGIPADVFMSTLNENTISDEVNRCIRNGFAVLEGNTEDSPFSLPELERSVSDFFDSYAAETGFTDTEQLDKKKQSTISGAYSVIEDKCDVFRFGSLKEHGVLAKASRIYPYRKAALAALIGAVAVIMLLMLAVNRKEKPAMLYWSGVSWLISGLFTALPSAYLLASGYFKAFTIKQAQIYTAYTSELTCLTKAALAGAIAVFTAGIAFIVLYSVFTTRDESVSPTLKEAGNS